GPPIRPARAIRDGADPASTACSQAAFAAPYGAGADGVESIDGETSPVTGYLGQSAEEVSLRARQAAARPMRAS
ncbi:hypothetical protein, partial [Rathayibacter sp. AY1A5]|uniref:hypothetical protein n=1 Tax=Rathayibacter sp. AY1A5 TaxID=2080523 RepID=UPI001CA4746E